jgi:hypothetical protein
MHLLSTNKVRIAARRMSRGAVLAIAWILIALLVSANADNASAGECGAEIIADLVGSGNIAEITATGQAGCERKFAPINGVQQPFFTHELACSPDRRAANEGICSTTPYPEAGQFFAFRTIHRPDGSSGPAGFSCVTLEQAVATPGVTVAQVFEAVRRVKLPGGEIGVEPEVRGLANLQSFFWVEGVEQSPVDLQVGGSTVHAEFRVVEYRWSLGGGEPLVTEGPGSPGLESEVRMTFARRGFYRVGVTVMWVAEAYLDGRRVGEVDDLVSRAETTYPVAELRTVLTG